MAVRKDGPSRGVVTLRYEPAVARRLMIIEPFSQRPRWPRKSFISGGTERFTWMALAYFSRLLVPTHALRFFNATLRRSFWEKSVIISAPAGADVADIEEEEKR